ncbi:transcription factor TFIIIB component B'' homolog [Anopheles ziemanni]|uniref:transcription factor TFIIIB component B'' homolog n=1 Tax=Anopheles coustani TaxID=139045 RepID=UPI002659DE3E|nr:transcription factor TFIIIB component B'' homolog [Anopheles coustani]XP_058177634.1 transcription factor TFIIIB component B'' homolog [Anopheles ziemanni]
MSSRRPRVKIAANLSIRRAPKAQSAGEQQKLPEVDEVTPYVKDTSLALTEPNEDFPVENVPVETAPKADEVVPAPEKQDEQHFKLPKPVDELPRHVAPITQGVDAAHISSQNIPTTNIIINNNNEEPMSPRKQEARFGYPFSLSRKRNRTESLTSNKSLPEGITVNKVARKIATKQEESQRTLENKKEIRKRLINIDNVKKQNLTMFDMIYYNPVNNPMQTPVLGTRSGSSENGQKVPDGRKSRSVSKSRSPTPLPAPPPAAVPKVAVQLTPQLKLGPNGEMILDEASLVIENEREKEIRDALASKDIVYQDEFSGNHGYYSRIKRTKDWTDEETIRFYRCLHTIGTDFSMMITLFPCRTRRDLKLKFKKEERLNLSLVNKALQHPKEFNLEELKQQFAQEDEEQERIRLQLEEETQEKLRQEKMNKKVVLEISKARNPKKRVSKSQRAMIEKELEQSESEDISQTTSIPKQRRRKKRKDDIKQDESATSLEASVNVAEPLESDHTGEISSRNQFDKQETASATATRKRRTVNTKVTKAKPEKKSANVSEDEEPNLCTSKPNELLTVPDPVPYIPNGMVGDTLPSSQPTSASELNEANTIDIAIPTNTATVDRPSSKTHENQLPLVEVPPDTPMEPVLQTSPVILLESLDTVNCPGEQTSLTQELAPVVMKYDDGIGADLEYLPLPGANAPVARKVRLDADTAYAFDDNRESLIELEPATVISTVGRKAVAGTKKSKQSNELNTVANTAEAESVGVQQPDESVCEIRQKIENDTDPAPSQQPLLKQPIDDDEYVAASDDGQEDECYVADEPIPEDDDYYSPKVEEKVDISKDGYLCETVAEMTIGKEEISAGEPLRGIPIEEVAGHSGTSKAEEQYEEVDLTELDVDDAVVAEGDNSLPGGTAAEEEEEEDGAGAGFSLEDIDINSLVLVESQDASEPNKTIYEIYVINPETGQLSEKPLDVPPDVIGNIRAILEADDGGS